MSFRGNHPGTQPLRSPRLSCRVVGSPCAAPTARGRRVASQTKPDPGREGETMEQRRSREERLADASAEADAAFQRWQTADTDEELFEARRAVELWREVEQLIEREPDEVRS